MLPHWAEKILEGMGFPGLVIFLLISALVAAVLYIRQMQAKADRIYGYRLQERDTLNKALSDTAKVLADMLKVTEDRNELTEEQAGLILKQAHAFELLKVSVLAQYETIKDNNTAASLAVSSMAEAIRTLTTIVLENRTIALEHVGSVRRCIDEMSRETQAAIKSSTQAQITELRTLLGDVTITRRRRSQ